MKLRTCIVLALGCFAVACEAVGTIGRATGVDTDEAEASSTGEDVELDAGSSGVLDPNDVLTTGERDPASGGTEDTETTDPTDPTDHETSTGDGPGTFMSETGTDTGTNGEPCCAPANEPGCADVAVESCVCELDPYCCDEAWDEACVNTALLSGCSSCPTENPPEQLDCCMPNMTKGCTDIEVQDCVCAVDPYCCSQAWDQMCVDKIDELGCGACPMN